MGTSTSSNSMLGNRTFDPPVRYFLAPMYRCVPTYQEGRITFFDVMNQLETNCLYVLKLKVPVFVGPHPVIQPFSHRSTFIFPWSLGYIRKLTFGSPWGYYFTPGFVCSQHTAPMNIKLAQIQPSKGTTSHIGRVEPRRYISCALRNSRKASVGFEPRTSRSAAERATTGPMRNYY